MPIALVETDDLSETRERLAASWGGGSDALLHTLELHSTVSVTDRAGFIIDVNDNFCRTSGYSRDELLGGSHSMLYSAVHDAAFWAAMWGEISAGRPWRGEICNRAKDGSLYWVDTMIAPILGGDGSPEIYISIRNDITASKLAEQRLRASESFLARTGRSASVGGWEFDIVAGTVQWSAQMMRIHEVEESYQPTLESGLSFYPPRARAHMEKAVGDAVRDGTGWDFEVPMLTGRGRTIWIRTVGQAEFEGDRAVRLVGSTQDITARKRIEKSLTHERARLVSLLTELQEANTRFSIASEAAGIAIWELGAACEGVTAAVLAWDERMYRMYARESAAGIPSLEAWIECVHPDDRTRYRAALERALLGDEEFDIDFRIVRPDGENRYLKAAARILRDAQGEALRMTGVNIDVTEAKRAELQLFKTSSMLRTVLDSAAEISIIATDPDLKIQVFNAGAERLLGLSSEEVVNQTTPIMIHDRAELRALSEQVGADLGIVLEGWEVFIQPSMLGRPRECTFRRSDGRALKVLQVVTAMHTYEGELLGYLSVGHDVTQQRQHEQSLREATHRAEQANRAKSAFLANMSHEIRTPMNAVIGLSYLLGRTALDDKQAGFLGNIQIASKSLLAILNDVLDLSKIEAGELMLELTTFRPVDLLNEVVEVMRVHADAKGIGFGVELPPDLPSTLRGDPTRLKQILTNLLSNAIRFTDQGRVALRVVHQPADVLSGSVTLRFSVKDTGIGISPEAQTRLFTPFAQADSSITRRYGGTGLGLSIVKSLVDVIGGTLHLESAPGAGSEFTVELAFFPALLDHNSTQPVDITASGRGGLPGLCALVVDDNDMNLQVVKHILELEGMTVALARNGQEALDRLQTASLEVDVVLMDVQMDGMGGHEATRLIRSELGLVDLPIIALTAGALSSERARAIAAGMDDFLVKPFESAALLQCIRKHVRISSIQAATPIAAPIVRPQKSQPWPQIEGIDSVDAKARLSNDAGLFLSSLARLLVDFADLPAALTAEEPAALRKHAERMHKLKGSAGMLGAKAIHVLAAEAEAACLAGAVTRAAVATASLVTELARLRNSAAPLIKQARRQSEGSVATSDVPIAADLMNELIQMLRQQNLSAVDRFRSLAPQLRVSLGAAPFEKALGHIDALQFNAVAEILGAVAQAPRMLSVM